LGPLLWDSDPLLIHGFLGPLKSASKRHLNLFISLCTAQHRDRAACDICSHIYAMRAMRPNNKLSVVISLPC